MPIASKMAASTSGVAAFRVNLLRNKKDKTVYCLEAGKDFVDLLLSFLTLPTGTILKLFEGGGTVKPLGAGITNVFESVKQLESSTFYLSKDLLLEQKPFSSVLAAMPNNVLKIQASPAPGGPARSYFRCSCSKTITSEQDELSCNYCSESTKIATSIFFEASNEPQKPGRVGFVKKNVVYFITDDLQISLASTISTVGLLSKLDVKDVTEVESLKVWVGSTEALQLLQSSWCKRAALNDVFGPKTKFAAQVA